MDLDHPILINENNYVILENEDDEEFEQGEEEYNFFRVREDVRGGGAEAMIDSRERNQGEENHRAENQERMEEEQQQENNGRLRILQGRNLFNLGEGTVNF